DRDLLRWGGVNALRYLKSDANAELLLAVLQSDVSAQPVRTKAYEVLLHWGVAVPLPRSARDMTALDLAGTDVVDKGLKQAADLKNLTRLDLRDTSVTDAGLKELAGLKKLTTLLLQDTQVTDAGVAELQKALPKCEIRRGTSDLPVP